MFSNRRLSINSRRITQQTRRQLALELLESRDVPSINTLPVTTLADSGTGSLRQAILAADAEVGPSMIEFQVTGTIQLTSGALPSIDKDVAIDGASAPDFLGSPLVAIDFNQFGGIKFVAGAKGSSITSLDLVDATGAGLTINGVSDVAVAGNYIGVSLNGLTAAGNSGDGILIENSSGDVIGNADADATSFELSNVISGNGLDGIRMFNAHDVQVSMNYIGTDATGTVAVANALDGIVLADYTSNVLIGGEATGGNDPTNSVFVQPPEGNVISGNGNNGVFMTWGANHNQLSGNFIGVDASGNTALGNGGDGVSIDEANNNSLIGCTITDDPFVFYNVVSGNGKNGLDVINSNGTTIQANFFGMGANNDTALGNALNGVVVGGTSTNTVMGGPIPLGNVDACNVENGLVVKDQASNFTTYNTFCGLAAFSTDIDFGNGQDGMLITSTGGNILIRTNVITENGGAGIEVGGNSQGVRIAGNIIGLDTAGNAAMGNHGDGILVDGNAHNILIGGPQPTFNIIPHNAISANEGFGVEILGSAHNITVSFSDIGTDLTGTESSLGNALGGVFLGAGTTGTTIGSPDPNLPTLISDNGGAGIMIDGSSGNKVIGTLIGTSDLGLGALGNTGAGIVIENGRNNAIGAATTAGIPANIIANNGGDGVTVDGGSGNAIRGSSIYDNELGGIDLTGGGNDNAPAPTITSLVRLATELKAGATLSAAPNSTYTVEVFANDANSQSGKEYLGSITVHTNGSGQASFTFYGPLPPAGDSYITMTATSSQGNTSEFSEAAAFLT